MHTHISILLKKNMSCIAKYSSFFSLILLRSLKNKLKRTHNTTISCFSLKLCSVLRKMV